MSASLRKICPGFEALFQISQCGSFTAAAELLEVSRSSVSKQLQALETSLDRRLLDRSTRSNDLTVEGERVLECYIKIRKLLEVIHVPPLPALVHPVDLARFVHHNGSAE